MPELLYHHHVHTHSNSQFVAGLRFWLAGPAWQTATQQQLAALASAVQSPSILHTHSHFACLLGRCVCCLRLALQTHSGSPLAACLRGQFGNGQQRVSHVIYVRLAGQPLLLTWICVCFLPRCVVVRRKDICAVCVCAWIICAVDRAYAAQDIYDRLVLHHHTQHVVATCCCYAATPTTTRAAQHISALILPTRLCCVISIL